MTAGSYSIGFTLDQPYATRATVRLREIEDAVPSNPAGEAAALSGQAPMTKRVGELRGFLEDCSPGRIAGWAQDLKHIDSPVRVAVLLDDTVLVELDADGWRQDLEDAFIGDGCHAFEFRPAQPLSAEKLARLKVVRVADGAELERLRR